MTVGETMFVCYDVMGAAVCSWRLGMRGSAGPVRFYINRCPPHFNGGRRMPTAPGWECDVLRSPPGPGLTHPDAPKKYTLRMQAHYPDQAVQDLMLPYAQSGNSDSFAHAMDSICAALEPLMQALSHVFDQITDQVFQTCQVLYEKLEPLHRQMAYRHYQKRWPNKVAGIMAARLPRRLLPPMDRLYQEMEWIDTEAGEI